SIVVSDKSDQYFSGVDSVQVSSSSPGWRLIEYTRPLPQSDAPATFRAVADPSGPLYVDLRDRDGNTTTVKLSDQICFKTAAPTAGSLRVEAEQGKPIVSVPLQIQTNVCGDRANILGFDFGSGDAQDKLEGRFDGF